MDAVVALEVGDRLRPALALEVGRGREDTERRVFELACHQPRVLRQPQADRQVEALFDKIDVAEEAVGLAAVVPFRLETRLRELGALFEAAPNWQAFAVRDRQFVTGQNLQSSALVAHHLLQALGLAGLKQAA